MQLSHLTAALLAGAVLLVAGVPAGAQSEPSAAERLKRQGSDSDRTQVEKRLQSVGTLLEKSSGARQVEGSGDDQAAQKRVKAREAYGKAQEAFKQGDYARTSKLLDEASALMFDAVRSAQPEKVAADKAKVDFQTRMDSVKALLAAQQRIAKEKSNVKDAAETSRSIEKAMQEANRLAAENKYAEARQTLDKAYLVARSSIGSMRGGDTLVRSLHFANKEEEYRYELDRNDTHQMLITVLLDEKRGDSDRMVQGFLAKAKQLRGEAEATASRGDHGKAVQLLEDSTAELVKAIRNSGIYIPG
jgi:tetratricopeptide (TPR) repeat protein